MCNCSKPKPANRPRPYGGAPSPVGKGTQEFSLTLRGGGTSFYGSRLEADAENARQGYTGIVKPL